MKETTPPENGNNSAPLNDAQKQEIVQIGQKMAEVWQGGIEAKREKTLDTLGNLAHDIAAIVNGQKL